MDLFLVLLLWPIITPYLDVSSKSEPSDSVMLEAEARHESSVYLFSYLRLLRPESFTVKFFCVSLLASRYLMCLCDMFVLRHAPPSVLKGCPQYLSRQLADSEGSSVDPGPPHQGFSLPPADFCSALLSFGLQCQHLHSTLDMSHHSYADDTQIYFCAKPDNLNQLPSLHDCLSSSKAGCLFISSTKPWHSRDSFTLSWWLFLYSQSIYQHLELKWHPAWCRDVKGLQLVFTGR